MHKQIIILLVVIALGCQQQAPDTRVEDEQAIRDVEDVQMLEAAREKDVERLMSFYAEDAVGFPPHAPMTRDKEASRQTWLEIVEYPSFTWQTTKVEVSRSSDLAYSYGTFDGSIIGPEGEPIDYNGKWVVVWKKQADGSWKHIIDIYNSDLPLPSASTL